MPWGRLAAKGSGKQISILQRLTGGSTAELSSKRQQRQMAAGYGSTYDRQGSTARIGALDPPHYWVVSKELAQHVYQKACPLAH